MRLKTLLPPLLLCLATLSPMAAYAQQWYAVGSEHTVSYSEGNDHAARDAAGRTEQLIDVFEELFHRKQVAFVTPLRIIVTHLSSPATLTRTPIANYLAIDPTQPEAWNEAARIVATLTLDDNYPRAQPWFDLGVAKYLEGVRFNGEQMELGGLPPGITLPSPADWIPLGKLLEFNDSAQLNSAKLTVVQQKAFDAESWALTRWLMENLRMAQAGAYLGAVQWRGATPERATAEAFSLSPADLDREVHASLAKIETRQLPAPHVDNKDFRSVKMAAADMHVIQANLSLFGPDGDRTLQELIGFMRQNQQNAMVHRSLAWAFLLRHDLPNAVEHIRRSLELEDSDPTMHYLYALWVNQGDTDMIHGESASVRIGAELKEALRRDPNYADALELLGLSELSDNQTKPALTNLGRASELCPRSSRYSLNLARAYAAAQNINTARNLLLYVRSGPDTAASSEARHLLDELGHEQKKQSGFAALQPDPNTKHSKYDNLQDAIAEDEAAEAKAKASNGASMDTRKTEHLSGRVIEVTCSSAEEATLTVESAGHHWKIRVADRKNAVLIGVDRFDCGWSGLAVSINYKRAGTYLGDLVSLEAD